MDKQEGALIQTVHVSCTVAGSDVDISAGADTVHKTSLLLTLAPIPLPLPPPPLASLACMQYQRLCADVLSW